MPNGTYILKYVPQVKLSGIWSKMQVSAKGNFGAIAICREETMPRLLSPRTVLLVRFLTSLQLSLALDFQPPGHLTCQLLFSLRLLTLHPSILLSRAVVSVSFSLHLNVSGGLQHRFNEHPLRFQTDPGALRY